MRHLAVCCAFAAVLLATVLGVDRLVARADTPGPVWVLVREDAAPAWREVLGQGDLRLVQAFGGGRLLQLHGTLPVRPDAAWMVLRLPAGAVVLAGCG